MKHGMPTYDHHDILCNKGMLTKKKRSNIVTKSKIAAKSTTKFVYVIHAITVYNLIDNKAQNNSF